MILQRPTATAGDDWDAKTWFERFRSASKDRDVKTLRRLRTEVFQGTAQAVRERGYRCGGKWIDLDRGGW